MKLILFTWQVRSALCTLHMHNAYTLAIKMFGAGGHFMMQNAYVPDGRIEQVRVVTPTSFSIFDSYDMKSL